MKKFKKLLSEKLSMLNKILEDYAKASSYAIRR